MVLYNLCIFCVYVIKLLHLKYFISSCQSQVIKVFEKPHNTLIEYYE